MSEYRVVKIGMRYEVQYPFRFFLCKKIHWLSVLETSDGPVARFSSKKKALEFLHHRFGDIENVVWQGEI